MGCASPGQVHIKVGGDPGLRRGPSWKFALGPFILYLVWVRPPALLPLVRMSCSVDGDRGGCLSVSEAPPPRKLRSDCPGTLPLLHGLSAGTHSRGPLANRSRFFLPNLKAWRTLGQRLGKYEPFQTHFPSLSGSETLSGHSVSPGPCTVICQAVSRVGSWFSPM